MSDSEIEKMLDEMQIPYAYLYFNDEIPPPFLIYVEEPPTHIRADGEIYATIRNITLELYSDKKDNALISKVEDTLNKHEIRFEKQEAWIETESMFEFAFTMQP